MKKIIAWLLVLALTAAVSIGATLAYLTDTDEDVNVMTIGKVRIDQLEYERIDTETKDEDATVQEFHDNKPLYPGVYEDGFDFGTEDNYVNWDQIGKDDYTSGIWNPDEINNEVDKMVFVKNKGNYDAYVRTVFAFEAGNYANVDTFLSMVHLNLNDTDWIWEWAETPVQIGESTYFVAIATYHSVLAPGAYTEISLSQIALDKSATNADVEAFGDTYQVLVKSQAIQADGFDAASLALDEGFGMIDADHIPWRNDTPTKGANVKAALHYLNADSTGPKITTAVTKVVFGLEKDYRNIVNGYQGVLLDDGQDVPAYAYYVPDGSNYNLYILSSDTIYAPKSCRSLFSGMKALTTVDTGNLDVSRVEDMYSMFLNCQKLTTLDVSDWDTSNVTNLGGAFANCYALEELDTSNWDLPIVESLYFTFQKCYALEELDASNWGLESVTTMEGAFAYSGLKSIDASGWDLSNNTTLLDTFKKCESLKTVKATGWNTGNVTTTKRMFFHTYELETVEGIADWNLPNNTDAYYMFEECNALTTLDLSGWNLSSVTSLMGMFYGCDALESVDVSGWDTGNVTTMYCTFYCCESLKEIKGIGQWDVSNVTVMDQMFRNCRELETLDVKDWKPSSCQSFSSMFSDITSNTAKMKLKDLDVSQWDMSSAQNLNWMFYGCGELTDLDLSRWDVSNVTSMYHAFADCFKMQNYNFSGWDTSSLENMDGIFNSNLALKSVDVSDFDTQNVVDFSQVFDGCNALEEIIGLDQWDTANGEAFVEFLLGTQVRELDLSSFNMSSAKETVNMFHVNPQLTTIYVGDNWNLNPDQLLDANGMFGSSPALVGGKGSTVSSIGSNSAIYARVDAGADAPGLLTHISDKPVSATET